MHGFPVHFPRDSALWYAALVAQAQFARNNLLGEVPLADEGGQYRHFAVTGRPKNLAQRGFFLPVRFQHLLKLPAFAQVVGVGADSPCRVGVQVRAVSDDDQRSPVCGDVRRVAGGKRKGGQNFTSNN